MKNLYVLLCTIFFLATNVSAQVPKLNSYPSASAVIFLDFDGHIVEGTSWNYDGPFVCNGSNLNATQLTEVFNRVAEDYRPFNINVTTDSTVYAAAPVKRRIRVVLTTSSSWYGSAGGVAFTNSFTWGDNTPCFVFTALLNYNVKNVAEAAAHEAGHTLGLNHQSAYDNICNKTSEYNSGTGTGEIGWAPIMGVGYYRNVTLWHYGSNPFGCSYMQDDLGIITRTANGFGFRADDHKDTRAEATTAPLVNSRFSVSGVIERPNDVDIVKFSLPAKSKIRLNALPFSVASGYIGANVDLQVEIVNSKGETVIYNPENSLRASVDTTLPADTYYLQVLSKGNEYAPNFAMLGSYAIEAEISAIVLPVHKLELKATATNNRHKLDWEIVADEAVVEQTIESSADGTDFQLLSNVAAAARSYGYQPGKSTSLYYRVRVLFDNGRTHYSNVAVLRGSQAIAKPFLVGNVINSTMTVNSPATFDYTIFDMNGRQVTKGRLVQGLNTLSAGFMTNGMYIIHYTNNQEQFSEKFMKK
ncbi:MAG TPA: T9SS type A sorting domain-containing protein [Flavisolibacter sp.]|jgi:hypothetical protein|nr:T9SS type A sorting domain-containing protein [Flavisolibacter sp.]